MESKIIIIACSIFRYELEHLQQKGRLNIPVVYLNSMLHMQPSQLQILLDAKIKEYKDLKIILMYGDCHARMVDYEKNPNIVRTPGINCCEIILGRENYRKIRNDGAFILLPEWANRWKEIFVDDMGFKSSKSAKLFMNEMHKKLVYVDTGFYKRNASLFDEVSDFLGLPIELYSSSIDELEKVINQLIEQSVSQEQMENGR